MCWSSCVTVPRKIRSWERVHIIVLLISESQDSDSWNISGVMSIIVLSFFEIRKSFLRLCEVFTLVIWIWMCRDLGKNSTSQLRSCLVHWYKNINESINFLHLFCNTSSGQFERLRFRSTQRTNTFHVFLDISWCKTLFDSVSPSE